MILKCIFVPTNFLLLIKFFWNQKTKNAATTIDFPLFIVTSIFNINFDKINRKSKFVWQIYRNRYHLKQKHVFIGDRKRKNNVKIVQRNSELWNHPLHNFNNGFLFLSPIKTCFCCRWERFLYILFSEFSSVSNKFLQNSCVPTSSWNISSHFIVKTISLN